MTAEGSRDLRAREAVRRGKPPTPNLDRIHEIHEQSEAFFEIIEWLGENTDLRLGRFFKCEGLREPRFSLVGTDRRAQVAVGRYFGIDLDEADRERDRLLEWVREQNGS